MFSIKFRLRFDRNRERVLIYDGFKFNTLLIRSDSPMKMIRVYEYPKSKPEEDSKFCAIYQEPRLRDGTVPHLVTWFDGKVVQKTKVVNYNLKLVGSKIADQY